VGGTGAAAGPAGWGAKAVSNHWDRASDSIVSANRRRRDSVWAMVANAFAALADPLVLELVSPGPNERCHPAEFLNNSGTLYLLGTGSGAASTASLVATLITQPLRGDRQAIEGRHPKRHGSGTGEMTGPEQAANPEIDPEIGPTMEVRL
jgi:hypothetical protein